MKNVKEYMPHIFILIIFFTLMAVITVCALPYVQKFSNKEFLAEAKIFVTEHGFKAWIFVLFSQILQVIIAFIPGEPFEIIAGALYGTIGGLGTCLLGCALASSFVFLLSKKYGILLIEKIFGKKRIEKFTFLHNSKTLETAVFLVFFIPGTPKDMLTYVAGTTPIKLHQFILITSLARIPSIVTSTFLGFSMIKSDWKASLLIFALTALFGITGIFYKERIISFLKHQGKKITERKKVS
jgi:uncharacterized membrane protein YdjX (TVP38/TMEM64 family)